jgi:hypothetical protein
MLRYIIRNIPLFTRGLSSRYYVVRDSSEEFGTVCAFYFSDGCRFFKDSTEHHIPVATLDTSWNLLELADVSHLIWRGYQILLGHQNEVNAADELCDIVTFTTYISKGVHPLDLCMY